MRYSYNLGKISYQCGELLIVDAPRYVTASQMSVLQADPLMTAVPDLQC